MNQHTREPWSPPFYDDTPGDCGWWIMNGQMGSDEYAITGLFTLNPRAEADARRIVACVNSCAEFSTEDLENSTTDKRHRALLIADLTIANKRCGELLAALETLLDNMQSGSYESIGQAYDAARALIAKVQS